MIKSKLFRSVLLAGALLMPAVASAAPAVATTNVNLRSGPSTAYPAVDVVRGGAGVEVHGCLSNRSWCDVTYAGLRGWMSSNYLAQTYRGQRYNGTRVVERLGTPVISFSFGNYWDNHYRGRPFYRDRDRYSGIGRGEVRREVRQERREDRWERRDDRRDDRWDRREERRDDRYDRRDDRRDDRGDRRGDRADRRDDRRDDRRGGDGPRRLGPGQVVIEGRVN